MTKKPALCVYALFAAMLLSSCGYTKIGRIEDNPSRYRNHTVRIEGNVTNSIGAGIAGGYQVDDGTGKIWILSENYGVPSKGARVTVTGDVVETISFAGKSFSTALRQTRRRD